MSTTRTNLSLLASKPASAPLNLIYRFYRLVSAIRYRVPRRFSHAGLAVLIALGAAGLLGVDTENSVAYQAVTLLTALLGTAVCFGWRFRGRFSVNRVLPRFGTVGQPIKFEVRIKNLTTRTQRGLTLLEDLRDPRPTFKEWLAFARSRQLHGRSFRVSPLRASSPFKLASLFEVKVPALPPNEEAAVPSELVPLRRGVLRFAGCTLTRADPLGLCRAFLRVRLDQTMVILPRRYPVPPLALPGTLKYQEGGVALASNVGQSDEFVALRDYRPGDPYRHIHWRSWARVGKPVVKEFEDEFFVRHALVLDTFLQDAYSDVFEEAVSVAASFVCTIPTQETLLDLLFVGPETYCFTAGRSLANADQMLEVLASVRVCADRNFSALEHLVLEHIQSVSGCICVLIAWDEERRAFVEKLRMLSVPVRVLVIVPPGQGKDLEPGPMQADPGKFNVLEAGRLEQGLANLE